MTQSKVALMLVVLTFSPLARADGLVINFAEDSTQPIEGRVGGGAGGFAGWPGSMWGSGFEPFMMTLTQLNMTPELTLDKDTKQKLQVVREQWAAAQAKFMADNKDQLAKIGQEQMEGFKAKDQERIKAAMQKHQELYAKGPRGEEYIAKAKAALTPDQLKVVDARIAKDDEQHKAMVERWRVLEKKEGSEAREQKAAPIAPVKPKE